MVCSLTGAVGGGARRKTRVVFDGQVLAGVIKRRALNGVMATEDNSRPQVSERLAKLCSWAVITMLESHPRKGGMAPTLVYKSVEDGGVYQTQMSMRAYESLDHIFDEARTALRELAEAKTVEAYALIVDYVEDIPDVPAVRAFDDVGNERPPEQPTIFVYLGERDRREGVMLAQSYRSRLMRGGAVPQGSPRIMPGPDSLLFEERPTSVA